MGTSLTPEFWERFAVLLVLAGGLTGVLTASLDSLAVRLLNHRPPNAPDTPSTLRSGGPSVVTDRRHQGPVGPSARRLRRRMLGERKERRQA